MNAALLSSKNMDWCKKGEEIVRYWFDVPPAEYDKYNIGDAYCK